MKHFQKFSFAALLSVGLAVASHPTTVSAQNAGQTGNFSGEVSSYDSSAQTVTVAGKTYQLLPTSRITMTDQTASTNTLAVGQQVQGRYKESAEGKQEVLTLNITQPANSAVGGTQDTTSTTSGTAFQGKIDKIDRKAKTFTIDGQTYQVLHTSRIVGKGGASVDLARLSSDQKVEGTYKESKEGKREVLTLDILRGNSAMGASQATSAVTSGASFQGKVDRVNRDAKTFTINGKTYQILPTSRIVGRKGSAVDISSVTQDEFVQGTYHESAEGKREVLTLQMGH